MKNILVIGNGFDLAHGLNTGYKDFVNLCLCIRKTNQHISYSVNIKEFVDQLNLELLNYGFQNSSIRKINRYFKSDESNYDFIIVCLENYWIDAIEKDKEKSNRWCDLEFRIKNTIECIAYIRNNIKPNMDRNTIKNTPYGLELCDLYYKINKISTQNNFYKKIDTEIKKLEIDFRKLTWLLETYISSFLNDKYTMLPLFKTTNFDYILNFNYTNTYNTMYKKIGKFAENHFIHGIAKKHNINENNNIILGIGDKIANTSELDKNAYMRFQKYYQRITKKTGNNYCSWLNNKEEIIVHIFGHSLDPVDGDVFRTIEKLKNTSFLIYYYDQNSLDNLVANLVEIFNVQKVIEMTNSNRIVFFKSNDTSGVNNYLEQMRNIHEIVYV